MYICTDEGDLLSRFCQAVTAYSITLPEQERIELIEAWQVVELMIRGNKNDFETTQEYQSLISYIKDWTLKEGVPNWVS